MSKSYATEKKASEILNEVHELAQESAQTGKFNLDRYLLISQKLAVLAADSYNEGLKDAIDIMDKKFEKTLSDAKRC